METDSAQTRATALAFLLSHKTGVLGTLSLEGDVHASVVYYTADENFNVYVLTLANSRKFKAAQAHPQVAFTVATSDTPQTLQLEGVAMDISLDEEGTKKKEELFKVLNSNPWFYGPITKLDPADTVVIWIRPTWIRWSDYAFAQDGNEHIFQEIPILK